MKDTAQFFKVLADEARLKMLWLLFNHRELCVCDIMAALDITQSKASRHLSTLKHARLVTDRKDGLWSYYTLSPVDAEFSRQLLDVLREGLTGRADASELLSKLHESLRASGRSIACTQGSCCAAAVKSQAAKAKRAHGHSTTVRRTPAGPQGDRP